MRLDEYGLLAEDRLHGERRLALHRGGHVAVEVEGGADAGVSEHLRNDLRVDVLPEKQRCSILRIHLRPECVKVRRQ